MISGNTYLCDECDPVWELAHLQKSRACILAALYLRPRPPFFSLRKSPSVAFRLLLRFPRSCLVLIALNLSVNLLLDIIERGAYSATLNWLDCVVLCRLISSLPLASSCPPFPNLAAPRRHLRRLSYPHISPRIRKKHIPQSPAMRWRSRCSGNVHFAPCFATAVLRVHALRYYCVLLPLRARRLGFNGRKAEYSECLSTTACCRIRGPGKTIRKLLMEMGPRGCFRGRLIPRRL